MKGVLCHICVKTLRFFEKHAQNLNTPQNNSANRDLQMGFNSAFKGLKYFLTHDKAAVEILTISPQKQSSSPYKGTDLQLLLSF